MEQKTNDFVTNDAQYELREKLRNKLNEANAYYDKELEEPQRSLNLILQSPAVDDDDQQMPILVN